MRLPVRHPLSANWEASGPSRPSAGGEIDPVRRLDIASRRGKRAFIVLNRRIVGNHRSSLRLEHSRNLATCLLAPVACGNVVHAEVGEYGIEGAIPPRKAPARQPPGS